MDERKNLTDTSDIMGMIDFDETTLDALERDWDIAPSGGEKTDAREDMDRRDSEAQPETQKKDALAEAVNDKSTPEADERFTLKHLDEVKTVGREEIIVLAQKGLDYDRIRAKVNEIESAKNRKETAPVKTPEQQAAEKRTADIREFLEEYGTALDPKTIPPEVWASVEKGKSLLSAYQSWENKQLKEENGTLKKTNENKARSTGSRETAGAEQTHDVIEDDWYKKE